MPDIYRYTFERELPKTDFFSPAQKHYKRYMFYQEASTLVKLINNYAGKPVTLMAPLPGAEISVYVSEPLSPSLLEQIAVNGYPCTNAREHKVVSDQAAE